MTLHGVWGVDSADCCSESVPAGLHCSGVEGRGRGSGGARKGGEEGRREAPGKVSNGRGIERSKEPNYAATRSDWPIRAQQADWLAAAKRSSSAGLWLNASKSESVLERWKHNRVTGRGGNGCSLLIGLNSNA